jgi:hypothetical protein
MASDGYFFLMTEGNILLVQNIVTVASYFHFMNWYSICMKSTLYVITLKHAEVCNHKIKNFARTTNFRLLSFQRSKIFPSLTLKKLKSYDLINLFNLWTRQSTLQRGLAPYVILIILQSYESHKPYDLKPSQHNYSSISVTFSNPSADFYSDDATWKAAYLTPLTRSVYLVRVWVSR